MKIAITGHRPNKLGNDYDLKSDLIKEIRNRIECIILPNAYHEDLTLITGMALGIDTLFAQIAVELKIPFIAAIPDTAQESLWNKSSKKIYYDLLSKAQEVINISGSNVFKIQHLHQRNIWIVNNCDMLIGVWDGSEGGTSGCIKYAVQKMKQIVYINPKKL